MRRNSALDRVIDFFCYSLKYRGYTKDELILMSIRHFSSSSDKQSFDIAYNLINKGIVKENKFTNKHILPIRILMLGRKSFRKEVSKKYLFTFCKTNPYFRDALNELVSDYPDRWSSFDDIYQGMLDIIEG